MSSTLDPARLLHTIETVLGAWEPNGTGRDRRMRQVLRSMRDDIAAGADPWDASQAALSRAYPLHLVGSDRPATVPLGAWHEPGGGSELGPTSLAVTPKPIGLTNSPESEKGRPR